MGFRVGSELAGKVPCSTIFGASEEAFGIIIYIVLPVSPTKTVRNIK
jgi:hypothetical protein